jgi:hypothetical protein
MLILPGKENFIDFQVQLEGEFVFLDSPSVTVLRDNRVTDLAADVVPATPEQIGLYFAKFTVPPEWIDSRVLLLIEGSYNQQALKTFKQVGLVISLSALQVSSLPQGSAQVIPVGQGAGFSGNLLVTHRDILDVIAEQGQFIQLGTPEEISAAKPEYGLDKVVEWQWRSIRGYCMPDRYAQKMLSAGMPGVTKGGFIGHFTSLDINPTELTGNARIRWNNVIYQIEALETTWHRNTRLMERVYLKQTQASISLESA